MKLLLATALATTMAIGAAAAQDFPTQTVTIVIPYSPGGSTDLLARQLANELHAKWGQPVVVENRPGAGSMIGTAYVAQAKPDGHTLVLNTAAHSTAPALQTDLPFDIQTDITPIAMVATSPYVLVGGAQVNSDNLADFIAEAKERPMFMATAGVGSSSHLAAELLIQQAGIPGDVVHFSGGGEANVALMGGHADTYISTTASVMPYVNNGQVKALGVLGDERFELLPDTQSSGEAGIDGIDVDGWVGLFGPGGMDEALVDTINSAVQEALATPAFQQVLQANFVLPGSGSADEFRDQVDREMALWRDLVAQRGITAD